jgi:hypothetical protein
LWSCGAPGEPPAAPAPAPSPRQEAQATTAPDPAQHAPAKHDSLVQASDNAPVSAPPSPVLPKPGGAPILHGLPSAADPQSHYLIYLHNRLVEEKGIDGVSEEFGAFDYEGILQALSAGGLTVVSELRPEDADLHAYGKRAAAQVRALIEAGVVAEHITVLGASKGAIMAMIASSELAEEGLGFVLMGSCNPWVRDTIGPRLTGEVLSIYEDGDPFGGSCSEIFAASPALGKHDEVRLTLGHGHGYLMRPYPQWTQPTIAWALRREKRSPLQ